MGNPNWTSFPGVANMTQDADGRPQVQDLIPGKQLGTPLEALFFNPLIRALCDLRDAVDAGTANYQRQDGLDNFVSGKYGLTAGAAPVRGILLGADGAVAVCVRKDGQDSWVQLAAAGDYLTRDNLSDALSGVVRSQPTDTDYQINSLGVNKATGDIWFWNGPTNAFFHAAPVSAVQAESVRAQTAEAGLQPAGNYVVTAGARRKKTLSFTVTVVQGQRVNFSEPFGDDDVQLCLTPHDSGNNRFHVANWFGVDRNGFSISLNAWKGGSFAYEQQETPVLVTATGWA